MSEKKSAKNVYINESLWEAARSKGLNISQLLTDKLREELKRDKCPTCGQKLPKKKTKT